MKSRDIRRKLKKRQQAALKKNFQTHAGALAASEEKRGQYLDGQPPIAMARPGDPLDAERSQ